jgi:outer membrane translocation and assembly module TamA
MHLWRGLFILPFLFAATYAQERVPSESIRLRTLTLISSTLPEPLREKTVQGLQGIEIDPQAEELRERVRQYLRDAGYYNARVDDAQISAAPGTPAGRFADVSFHVDPGALYILGEIRFENEHVFPQEEIRRQFPTKTGEHFNATEVGLGLDNLRKLYAAKGYANFGAIPKPMIDEARRIVDLTIDMDEGLAVHYGRLILEGTEPRPGVGKSLLDAWNLEGKLYNPQVLKEWLAANTSGWSKDAAEQVDAEFKANREDPFVYNVLLHFQQRDH